MTEYINYVVLQLKAKDMNANSAADVQHLS